MKLMKDASQDSSAPEQTPPPANAPASAAAKTSAAPPQKSASATSAKSAAANNAAAETPEEETLSRGARFARRAAVVARCIVQSRGALIAAAAAAGLAVLGYVGYNLYVGFLLTSASQAVLDRNYESALQSAGLYETIENRSAESLRILARARMFAGEYEELRTLVSAYSGDDVEMRYLQAVGKYSAAPEETHETLAALAVHSDNLPYIPAAEGVFKLVEKDWNTANEILVNIAETEDAIVNLHLLALYDLFLDSNEIVLRSSPPPPFSALREANDRGLGFAVDAAGFNNTYGVPLSADDIGAKFSGELDISSLYRGLRLLARTQTADAKEIAGIAAAGLSSDASLLARYLAGYHFALLGEYGRVAEVYREISERSENSSSALYEASALWMNQNGAPPEERVFARLRRAMELNSRNLAALNNAAYLEFNFGDADEAERLIGRASEIGRTDPNVTFNRVLIRLAAGNVDYETAQADAAGLLAQYPQSDTVYHLAAAAESGIRNFQGAINILSRLSELRPDAPALALQIADRYRYLGQMFLAIQELAAARKQFPGNEEIAGAHALYLAINNDKKAANALAEISSESPYALHAQAVILRDDDYEKAADSGERALSLTAPHLRAAVAIDMTRIYLNAGEVESAAETFAVARESAADSPLFGMPNALAALDYRIQAERNAPIAEEVQAALEAAAKDQDVFAQIDMALALIRLGRAEAGVTALENLRSQQRIGNLKTPDLFAALISGYKALNREDDIAKIREDIAAIESGKAEEEETVFAGAKSAAAQKVFSGRSEALAAANKLIKKKDYRGAIEIFTSLIEDEDSKVEKPALSFQNRGVLYMKIKLYEEAARDFATALKMREQLSQNEFDAVHYNYINALARSGDYDNLEEEVNARLAEADEAGGKFAHEKQYMRILALGLVKNGSHDKAVAVYQDIIAKHPRDVSIYVLMSDALAALERFDRAISALSTGLEIDPENVQMHERLMQIYQKLGDDDNAQREMEIIQNLRG